MGKPKVKSRAASSSSSDAPKAAVQDSDSDSDGDPLAVEVEGIRYKLDRPPSKGGRKNVITIRLVGDSEALALIDRADLYAHRQRERLAQIVSQTYGKEPGVVMGHLACLLDQVERAALTEKKPKTVALTAARTKAAEKLLNSAKILDRAVKVLDALGLVGEDANKRRLYLVATSRLLEKPISAILRASAASGKSELVEKVLELMPDEAVESITRLTPHALFYAGADALRHKLVVVDEQPGAAEADHPIRVLQSSGRLTLALVVKGKTERFTVSGPISLLSGTTAPSGNVENSSRCLELTLDDSAAQTMRIHEAQRRAWAGEQRSAVDVEVLRDAQRLLEPLPVVIPFATKLRFPATDTTHRRDQPKLLGLVAAHALLHQRQRDRDDMGRVIATPADYRVAFELFAPLVEAEFEDLSPRAAQLYRLLAKERSSGPVSRRDAATLTGWSYTTTRRALEELLAHELLKIASRKTPIRYLILQVPLTEGTGLTPPDEIE